MEKGKTSLMVAQQEQLVAVKREETQKLQAKIQAVCALIASIIQYFINLNFTVIRNERQRWP